MEEWGFMLSFDLALVEFLYLRPIPWGLRRNIVDVGMTPDFEAWFVAHPFPHLIGPRELHAFIGDEKDKS